MSTTDETQVTSHGNPAFEPGQLIKGRYRLGDRLGGGGMGAVYEVEHVGTGRTLAMKVLKPDVARRPHMVRRFVAEARAAALIPHPAIVEIVDLDREGDCHFIVMERLFGEELAAMMRRLGPLPIPFVVELGKALADAMSAAHRNHPQVIHRDLKPENVFLAQTEAGPDAVKILDFGIAKLIERDGFDEGFTMTGEVCGTPTYMSPEQLRSSRDVDERTDIYAIGVILYQALTARLPFRGESFADLILLVNGQNPTPVRELRPEAPPALARLVERAIARRRENRFANAADLSAQLSTCLTEPADLSESIPLPVGTRGPSYSFARTARWPIGAAWAAAIGLVVGLLTALYIPSRPEVATGFPPEAPSLTRSPAPETQASAAIRASSVPPTIHAAAEDLVQKGVALRRQGEHAEAYDYLRQAFELSPTPRPSAQLGLVEYELRRWVDAETHLQQALKSPDDTWVRKNRETLVEALHTVQSHITRDRRQSDSAQTPGG
jgi:eukaryotic-like serine/threonine-protein kinase